MLVSLLHRIHPTWLFSRIILTYWILLLECFEELAD